MLKTWECVSPVDVTFGLMSTALGQYWSACYYCRTWCSRGALLEDSASRLEDANGVNLAITDAKGSENHSVLNSISWYQASNFCAYIVPINMYWEILSWSVFRAKVAWSDWVGDPGNKPKVLEWPKFRSWGVKVARARTRKPAFYISK